MLMRCTLEKQQIKKERYARLSTKTVFLVEKEESPGMLKFEHERLSVKESQGKVRPRDLGGAPPPAPPQRTRGHPRRVRALRCS